jgi:hypothetical protein
MAPTLIIFDYFGFAALLKSNAALVRWGKTPVLTDGL